MLDTVLYIHIVAAAAWIGGSILLFVLGITLRDKEAQKIVYFHIGPLYGYFETFVLIILLVSGGYLYYAYSFHSFADSYSNNLGYLMHLKIAFVVLITVATIIHMYISLKANGRDKTFIEKIFARSTSMIIFLLNFVILWIAIDIRDFL